MIIPLSARKSSARDDTGREGGHVFETFNGANLLTIKDRVVVVTDISRVGARK
jgi:hypothetical protein